MKNHLKRLATPKTWKIKRKGLTFVTRPTQRGHSLVFSLPLNVILRDHLKHAKTTKEVKYILHEKEVLVDEQRQQDYRVAVGFLDVIRIPILKETYRVVLDYLGRLTLIAIPEKEAHLKICRIIRKTVLQEKKHQLNLNDGRNILLEGKDAYCVGDSVVIDLKTKKITQHLPLREGAFVYLLGGKHMGALGAIKHIKGQDAVFHTSTGEEYITPKTYAFVVGEGKPALHLVEEKKHDKEKHK